MARSSLAAFAEQYLDGREETSLTLRRRFLEPLFRRRAEALQNGPGEIRVSLGEERMVVAQGLAPIGHEEVGLRGQSCFESLLGGLEREAVQKQHAVQKMLLRFRGFGRGLEIDGS